MIAWVKFPRLDLGIFKGSLENFQAGSRNIWAALASTAHILWDITSDEQGIRHFLEQKKKKCQSE